MIKILSNNIVSEDALSLSNKSWELSSISSEEIFKYKDLVHVECTITAKYEDKEIIFYAEYSVNENINNHSASARFDSLHVNAYNYTAAKVDAEHVALSILNKHYNTVAQSVFSAVYN